MFFVKAQEIENIIPELKLYYLSIGNFYLIWILISNYNCGLYVWLSFLQFFITTLVAVCTQYYFPIRKTHIVVYKDLSILNFGLILYNRLYIHSFPILTFTVYLCFMFRFIILNHFFNVKAKYWFNSDIFNTNLEFIVNCPQNLDLLM